MSLQVNKMVDEALSETQCDSCFETATSARSLNGVCVVSPAVVHCIDCVQNLCVSCCSRICKTQSTHDDVRRPRVVFSPSFVRPTASRKTQRMVKEFFRATTSQGWMFHGGELMWHGPVWTMQSAIGHALCVSISLYYMLIMMS